MSTTVTIRRTMSPSAMFLLVTLHPWDLGWQGTDLLPPLPQPHSSTLSDSVRRSQIFP